MGILESLHHAHQQRQDRINQAAIKYRCSGLDNFSIISNELCTYYNIRPQDLFSRRRQMYITEKRQILVYMLYHLTKMTNPQIAAKLERDVTSIRYALDRITSKLTQYGRDLEILEKRIKPYLHP